MSIAPDQTHVTLEELLASPDAGRFEIVNGELEEIDKSNLSNEVAYRLSMKLRLCCEATGAGQVLSPDTYYQ